MSEKSSEYLKRTCLICGCHTNQTINIYEPRSGPNIVQLIQAKFKFQPLNEDKYLCYSCNNWLINWHSLQGLNSNEAESPSGTFRSHLNSGNVLQEEKGSGSKKQIAVCRPFCQGLQPRKIADPEDVSLLQQPQQGIEENNIEAAREPKESNTFLNKVNFNKRMFRLQLVKRGGARLQQKSMQQCICGKYMVVRTTNKSCWQKATNATLKCRKCREFSRWKAAYLRSIVQVEKELAQREPPPNLVIDIDLESGRDANTTDKSQIVKQQQAQTPQAPTPQIQQHYLPKQPTVDGKVVSMLRRLGTTLSREPPAYNAADGKSPTTTLPQIMSPTKPKSKWLRPLADDEILIHFDSSISEVLPSLADQFTHAKALAARKCLTFQASDTAEVNEFCEQDSSVSEVEDTSMTEIDTQHENFISTCNLPKCLTITLI